MNFVLTWPVRSYDVSNSNLPNDLQSKCLYIQ